MERPLGYRILRYGLKVATRAANDVVDRVIARGKTDATPAPAPRRDAPRRRGGREPVAVVFLDESARQNRDGPVPEVTGTVEPGTTLLEAADLLGLDVNHYCGGNASCGTCRVEVVEGGDRLSRMQSMERMALGGGATPASRLACQTRVNGPARVRVPEWW